MLLLIQPSWKTAVMLSSPVQLSCFLSRRVLLIFIIIWCATFGCCLPCFLMGKNQAQLGNYGVFLQGHTTYPWTQRAGLPAGQQLGPSWKRNISANQAPTAAYHAHCSFPPATNRLWVAISWWGNRGQLSALHCSTGPAGFPMASTIFNKHSRMSMCSVLHSPTLLPLSLHNLENLPNALMELRTQTTSGQNSQASFFLLPFEPCKWTFKSL